MSTRIPRVTRKDRARIDVQGLQYRNGFNGCGSPELDNTHLSVMSTASRAPPKHGKSWARTSMPLASRAVTPMFISLRNALNLTLAPASQQTRANIRWMGVARFRSLPVSGQAALCRPNGSSWELHPKHTASSTAASVPTGSRGTDVEG